MKTFLALLNARNKEFFRDRASLSWALLLPIIIIVSVAVAFSGRGQILFTIGVAPGSALPAPLQKTYIKAVEQTDWERAETRLRHHQLDLLLSGREGDWQYWVNTEAAKGDALSAMLADAGVPAQRHSLSGRAVRYIDWAIPGILGMNIMFGALFGVGYVLVRYRKMGILKRLQATPVTSLQFLSAQLVSRLLIVVAISALIVLGCHFSIDFLMLGSYWLLLLIGSLGAFSMIALGLLVASRTDNEELAGGLLNMATYPMLLLSEVWFSLEGAPDWMQSLAQCLPLTHMLAAARAVMLEGATLADIGQHLIILAVMSAVLLAVACVCFRWGRR